MVRLIALHKGQNVPDFPLGTTNQDVELETGNRPRRSVGRDSGPAGQLDHRRLYWEYGYQYGFTICLTPKRSLRWSATRRRV